MSIVICVQCVERCGNADSNVFVHCILCLGAVDRDGHDAISNFRQNSWFTHYLSPYVSAFILARLHTDATIHTNRLAVNVIVIDYRCRQLTDFLRCAQSLWVQHRS